jgi:hypothetical protein
VYARDRARQLLFTVEPSMLTDVKKTAEDFRDKDLFEFRSFNALRLRVVRGSDTYEFQKVTGSGQTADKWQRVVDGKATDLDTAKVEDFLSKLSALRAQSFNATTNAAGNAEPALVASASYDTSKFERVRFIKGDKQMFAAREGESGAAVVDQGAFDETLKALDAAIAPPAPAAAAPPAK